ncbi:FkbM family methyltransferase [Nitrospira japonica]|uniref:FkbM family methyltransferase n=1 Tax=Nitrospira japonica TaxID=1325564 RepID=UPI00155FD9D9|nr:FkbM family methyltransferase [Nitrospira japonica]
MKKLIQRTARAFGIEIRRIQPVAAGEPGSERPSLEGSLTQAREAGLDPKTVIDVGAAVGSFTRTCRGVFPDARYLLVEPLEEYLPSLDKVVKDIPGATYELAAATDHRDGVMVNIHPDLVGSSLYRETEEGSEVNGIPRKVPSVTVDALVRERHAEPPYVLKIDVQGAELDVLAGAERVLQRTDLVLLEVSLFQFFERGPVFCDIVEFMKTRGFVPYDILNLQYRPLDHALSQVDISFVKENGAFRRHHYYATPDQRHDQNVRFRSHLIRLLSVE